MSIIIDLYIMIIYFRDLKIYFNYCFLKFNKLFVRKIFQGYWKFFFYIPVPGGYWRKKLQQYTNNLLSIIILKFV